MNETPKKTRVFVPEQEFEVVLIDEGEIDNEDLLAKLDFDLEETEESADVLSAKYGLPLHKKVYLLLDQGGLLSYSCGPVEIVSLSEKHGGIIDIIQDGKELELYGDLSEFKVVAREEHIQFQLKGLARSQGYSLDEIITEAEKMQLDS